MQLSGFQLQFNHATVGPSISPSDPEEGLTTQPVATGGGTLFFGGSLNSSSTSPVPWDSSDDAIVNLASTPPQQPCSLLKASDESIVEIDTSAPDSTMGALALQNSYARCASSNLLDPASAASCQTPPSKDEESSGQWSTGAFRGVSEVEYVSTVTVATGRSTLQPGLAIPSLKSLEVCPCQRGHPEYILHDASLLKAPTCILHALHCDAIPLHAIVTPFFQLDLHAQGDDTAESPAELSKAFISASPTIHSDPKQLLSSAPKALNCGTNFGSGSISGGFYCHTSSLAQCVAVPATNQQAQPSRTVSQVPGACTLTASLSMRPKIPSRLVTPTRTASLPIIGRRPVATSAISPGLALPLSRSSQSSRQQISLLGPAPQVAPASRLAPPHQPLVQAATQESTLAPRPLPAAMLPRMSHVTSSSDECGLGIRSGDVVEGTSTCMNSTDLSAELGAPTINRHDSVLPGNSTPNERERQRKEKVRQETREQARAAPAAYMHSSQACCHPQGRPIICERSAEPEAPAPLFCATTDPTPEQDEEGAEHVRCRLRKNGDRCYAHWMGSRV